MKTSTVLRVLIILEWVLLIPVLGLYVWFEPQLPIELNEWVLNQSDNMGILPSWFFVVVMIPTIILYLIGSVGLFMLRRWGAILYLATTIIATSTTPFEGPSVIHAIEETIGEFITLLNGAIIGIAFFGNVLKKKTTQDPTIETFDTDDE